ncbi:hypothetical protein TRIUR3_18431 [Triticum urartu]|uniref:Remorin C-terminal domain-containing protein n=1 Tax=Triticum urartu TaxID=4572 RepID=M7ZQ31_TRIUA|nr:hypothetical protein TRIUR3_18431 [Triticum urartu]
MGRCGLRARPPPAPPPATPVACLPPAHAAAALRAKQEQAEKIIRERHATTAKLYRGTAPFRRWKLDSDDRNGGATDQHVQVYEITVNVRAQEVVEVRQVKKEEAEAKVAAWQAEEVAKINNKFKREEVVINGWENQQIHTATAYLSKIERKLEEERAKATEKAQNEVARARRKAEEKRASAEAARGTKTARVMDLANFMKAVGRLPTKRSFFSFSSS